MYFITPDLLNIQDPISTSTNNRICYYVFYQIIENKIFIYLNFYKSLNYHNAFHQIIRNINFIVTEILSGKKNNSFLYFFQVFGLGNKTYEHYNKVAVYVDKRLEELGATRVFELGLGDDDAK